MSVDNTYKALIATILFSTLVLFLGFTIHIKKKNTLVAETHYELLAEDDILEELEELEEILKSMDNLLSTNKAFNETKEYDVEEDEEFKEQLDKIKNRNSSESIEEALKRNSESYSAKNEAKDEETSDFSDINDIIEKRSEKNRNSKGVNKNSSISFSLVDRDKIYIPPPIYLCEKGGKMVINITVDQEGNVTDAYYNNASSSNDGCLLDHALEYAKASKFTANTSKASQLGTITFIFKGKN